MPVRVEGTIAGAALGTDVAFSPVPRHVRYIRYIRHNARFIGLLSTIACRYIRPITRYIRYTRPLQIRVCSACSACSASAGDRREVAFPGIPEICAGITLGHRRAPNVDVSLT